MDYQILPDLTEDEYALLREDIKQNGVLVPIILDEHGEIIDGYHRVQICQELGIQNYPRQIRPGLSEADKVALSLSINTKRRGKLSKEQRDVMICALYNERHISSQVIGDIVDLKRQQVNEILNRSGVKNHTPEDSPARVTGKDGKSYPAKRMTSISANTQEEVDGVVNGLQNLADVKIPKTAMNVKRFGRIVREAGAAARREEAHDASRDFGGTDPLVSIRHGDFRDVLQDIKDGSVSLVLTDPPYPAEFLPLWEDLAAWAARVLKPGGLLVTYSGQLHLPAVLASLSRHLDYQWMIAALNCGPACAVHARNVNSRWKPVLIYAKPPVQKGTWFTDLVQGEGPEKDRHDWQQAEAEAVHFIDIFSKPGDLVVDPFLGSGTAAVAAARLKRNFAGCDIDEDAVLSAKERLECKQTHP